MIAGLDADPDDANPERPGIGDFVPGAPETLRAPPASLPSDAVDTPPSAPASWLQRTITRLRGLIR